jgi:hypothetical protein
MEVDDVLDGSVLKALDEVWEEDDTLEVEPSRPRATRGYSCVIDNINQKTHTRHNTKNRSNKQYNMVQGYAFRDRVDTLVLSDDHPNLDLNSIPIQSYLPSQTDLDVVRNEMAILVKRILTSYLPSCKELVTHVPTHIHHEFLEESGKKTERVIKLISCI